MKIYRTSLILEKKLKNEVIIVNIGVKRHCGDRNLKTKTAVLSEFNNKLTNRHAKLRKIKTSTCLLKVFQGLLFPSLLNFPFTTHTRIVTCQKSRIFEP